MKDTCSSSADRKNLRVPQRYCRGFKTPGALLLTYEVLYADLFTMVTAVHHTIGGLGTYVASPELVTAQLRPGIEIKGLHEAIAQIALTLGTGHLKPMLLDDYTHLLVKDQHYNQTKQVFVRLQAELAALSTHIAKRNEERVAAGRYPFHRMDPANMRTSVSV